MDEFAADKLINNAIDELSDDSPRKGAEALAELANLFAKAGFKKQQFDEIRQHIIESAIRKTDPIFIKHKLEVHEALLQEKRNGSTNKIII